MRTFTTFLTEQKNLHLEHLEDELFNRGEAGVNEAIAFLKSLSEMLKGNAKSPVNVTVKSDGDSHHYCLACARAFFVKDLGRMQAILAEVDAEIRAQR